MTGKVTLVGAGPGDKGLLTLKGMHAIQNAEVVVYDRLVGPAILAMMPNSAEKINVGKKSSQHLVPQEQINQILLEKALEGKNVVRLKGGDCFLFGRGGEELELLSEHNIKFEVIPGVTSALSVPAYAGIPVTHREFVSSLHIITGHPKGGKDIDIDFDALVRVKGTLVFLMSVSNLEFIMSGLLNAGMKCDMPCAVIERGTTSQQRKFISNISEMTTVARENNVISPSIIVVGEVCTLSDSFDWFSTLPLKDTSILVTRPKERIGTLSDKLRAQGAEVLEFPCIETVSKKPYTDIKLAFENISNYKWLVFTSPAGVQTMFEFLENENKDVRALYGLKLAAIGNGTAKELKKYGLIVDFIPEVFDANHLAKGLCDLAKGERVLILRAEMGTKELTDILSAGNIEFDDVHVYDTIYRNEKSEEMSKRLVDGEIDYVTFTSASTVTGFVNSVSGVDFTKVKGLCIGEQTADEAKKYGIKTIISQKATIDSMLNKLMEDKSNDTIY